MVDVGTSKTASVFLVRRPRAYGQSDVTPGRAFYRIPSSARNMEPPKITEAGGQDLACSKHAF